MKENYNAQDDIKSITKPFKAQSGPMNGTPLGIKNVVSSYTERRSADPCLFR